MSFPLRKQIKVNRLASSFLLLLGFFAKAGDDEEAGCYGDTGVGDVEDGPAVVDEGDGDINKVDYIAG